MGALIFNDLLLEFIARIREDGVNKLLKIYFEELSGNYYRAAGFLENFA